MEENQCIRISVPPTSLLDGGGTRQSDQIAPPTHSQLLQTLAEAASLSSINPTITACPHEAHSSLLVKALMAPPPHSSSALANLSKDIFERDKQIDADQVSYVIATRTLLPTNNEPHDHHDTCQCLHIA
jgi:hypothetical protein